MSELPDHVLRNRASWDEWAVEYADGGGARCSGSRCRYLGRMRMIDDNLVEELAAKADSAVRAAVPDGERGYDVDEIVRRRGGRPPIGSGPASVESVRLDPELRRAVAERAERDQESTSSVIRKALRRYLNAG